VLLKVSAKDTHESAWILAGCWAVVFLRGGESYQRLEPDFIVVKDGVFAVVEVDGDTFHPETASAARTRLKLLEDAGAYIVRVNANACSTPEFAEACAEGILNDIDTHKNNRR
jgi:hypothetical protein